MDRNTRILVVDDNENLRSTIQAMLKNDGYTVDLAANGSEAIKKAKEMLYNVVLINIPLPDMEGIELLNLINGDVQKTRKIIVTSFPSMKSAIAALNKNANTYLIKPLTVESF